MRVDLVLTIIGQDRPGLVELVSRTVTAHGGNWEGSRMARLSGRFAGILKVTVAEEGADRLVAALAGLEGQGLRVVVERAAASGSGSGGEDSQLFRVDLVGNDRPGVIRDISSALAEGALNVEELATECQDAPMAGGNLLKMTAHVRAPRSLGVDRLRQMLEARAPDFMVDVAAVGKPGDPS